MTRERTLSWLKDESQSATLRATLQAARDDRPADSRLEAIAARVSLGISGPGGPDGGGTTATAPVSGAKPEGGLGLSSHGALLKLGATAVAAGVAAAVWWSRAEPQTMPEARSATEVGVPRAPQQVAVTLPHPPPIAGQVDSNSDELNRLQIKPSKKETAKPAQHEVDPNEEARLLGLARRAIKSDPAQTLKRVARHRRLFGTGTFGEERDALEIEALHYTGQAARARERLESFVARYPASIHRPRLSARVP